MQLRQWDPIGFYDDQTDAPDNAYDSYIPQLLYLLAAGGGADAVAGHLTWSRLQMGVEIDPAMDRAVAERMANWWRNEV